MIGASANRAKFGNKCVRAYLDEGYTVYPVNPIRDRIEGRKVYRSVLEIPGAVDVASLYLPPKKGVAVLEEIAKKQIPEVIVNPGAESPELIRRGRELGIGIRLDCSIVAIGRDPNDYPEE